MSVPSHLLLLHHSLGDDFIDDCRFRRGCRNRSISTVRFSVVGQRIPISIQILGEHGQTHRPPAETRNFPLSRVLAEKCKSRLECSTGGTPLTHPFAAISKPNPALSAFPP